MSTLLARRQLVASALADATYTKRLQQDTPAWEVSVATVPYRGLEIITDSPDLNYTSNPLITVMGLAFDEDSNVRATKTRHLILRVFIEALIEPKRHVEVDDLIDLTDQVLLECSNVVDWVRMEVVRDEHGMPFLFHVIREKALFQAVMQPIYYETSVRVRSTRRF